MIIKVEKKQLLNLVESGILLGNSIECDHLKTDSGKHQLKDVMTQLTNKLDEIS